MEQKRHYDILTETLIQPELFARKIADKGFTKLLQHHTTQQRASQFLSFIEEYL